MAQRDTRGSAAPRPYGARGAGPSRPPAAGEDAGRERPVGDGPRPGRARPAGSGIGSGRTTGDGGDAAGDGGAGGRAWPAASVAAAEPPSVPAQVRRHSVRGQVLDALRTALAEGELAPGEVYSAPTLGRRLGVSATPVREAMLRLAAEGSVEVVPNRGFRVAERDPAALAELAEVRALVEVPVLLRLARLDPAPDWSALRPLAERCAAAAARGERAAYAAQDRAFHRALLVLGGNRQLVLVADDLHRRAQWPPAAGGAAGRAGLVADAAEHTALLDALAARDLPAVAAVLRDHFTGAGG
ncbi:GntR family transcriptional regulator [Streptomyces tremellae]|uniref:HTH gntR-type domain-containing protein n=1 Tax=Streptomyces tremellae TaxID=1124239 RepID=A0ABP7F8H5_9ACTN